MDLEDLADGLASRLTHAPFASDAPSAILSAGHTDLTDKEILSIRSVGALAIVAVVLLPVAAVAQSPAPVTTAELCVTVTTTDPSLDLSNPAAVSIGIANGTIGIQTVADCSGTGSVTDLPLATPVPTPYVDPGTPWITYLKHELASTEKEQRITAAPLNTVAQARRFGNALYSWAVGEQTWLDDHQPMDCYADQHDAWYGAVGHYIRAGQLIVSWANHPYTSANTAVSELKQGNSAYRYANTLIDRAGTACTEFGLSS